MVDSSTSELFLALVKSANLVWESIYNKTSSSEYPQGDTERMYSSIGDAMYIKKPVSDSNGIYIDLCINLSLAPYAAAYEWGSGLWKETGMRAKYEIWPVKKKFLAFPWTPRDPDAAFGSDKTNMPKWAYENFKLSQKRSVNPNAPGWDVPDFWFFNWVEHPGIHGRPYIRPAIQENANTIKGFFNDAARKIVADVIGNLNITVNINL